MSIFKSICADLAQDPFPTRVSFGGGFQMPKHQEVANQVSHPPISENLRKTSSFKQEHIETGKQNLLSSINQEISKLKGDSNSIAEIRVKNNLDFPSQNLTSFEELEKLRLIHQEKLKVLETEYLQHKERKRTEEPIHKDVLAEYSEYKKAHISSKYKFNHELTYAPDSQPPDDKETLLKWLFTKLDTNNSGTIEKHEMLQEICDNQELREYFGFSEEGDLISELSAMIPSDFLSKADFLKFFLSIRSVPKETPKSSLPPQQKSPAKANGTIEYPVVVLNKKQLHELERVFNETDVHGDMTVQRFEYFQSLRTDDDIIKILQCNAIEIAKDNFVTLEEVLDRLQDTEDLYEYITYSQFLNYFYIMFPKQTQTPEELGGKVRLDPLYVQILRDIFNSLPRKGGKGMVSTGLLIDSLKEDPQINEFLKEPARDNETVAQVLQRVNKESAGVISWEDFLEYFSEKGKPSLKSQENTSVNRGNYYAMKQDFYKENNSLSPKEEKPRFKYDYHDPDNLEKNSKSAKTKKGSKKSHSKSAMKFTVPAPFEFEQREKVKHKSIRQQKFELYIHEKQREEENHMKYHPPAMPVPAEVVIPKYNTMMAAQEARRDEVKKNSKQITKQREKPFDFYIREMNKVKPEERKEEPYRFKAKPPPPSNSIPLYEQLSRKGEEDRISRIEIAAKKALEEAKLPPRMERYAKGDKNLSVPPSQQSNFKAKKPPEFAKLWENLGKDMEKKKQSFQPTQPKEFNITEAKKKSQVEDNTDDLMKKGFLEMFKKKPIPLDPPKDLPKPTKKQIENEENAKKRREDQKVQEDERKKQEDERKLVEEEAQKKKDAKMQRETEESRKRGLEGKERLKEMDNKYSEDKKKMMDSVKNRPQLSDTISSEYSKANSQPRTLTSIKQKMQSRGIQISDIIGEVDGFPDIIAENLV